MNIHLADMPSSEVGVFGRQLQHCGDEDTVFLGKHPEVVIEPQLVDVVVVVILKPGFGLLRCAEVNRRKRERPKIIHHYYKLLH